MIPLLLSLMLGPVAAQADGDEPPIVRRPPHFNGAVGTFAVAARAEPAEVQAEDPLTYTVRVTASGPVRRPPSRPKLTDFPAFAEAFYVEDIGPPEGTKPDENTWEFAYRLKPKSAGAGSVPGFPFVSFKPGVVPAWRGYQTHYTSPLPLTVRPRVQVKVSETDARPIPAPEATFDLASGPAVLRHNDLDRLPDSLWLGALFALPPLGCVAWYVVWRRLYPDAAKRARQRRSRAAEEALAALRRLGRAEGDERARRTALVVARYLRHRHDLPADLPTPAEAAFHLRRGGLSEEGVTRAADFFRACDAARFAPGSGEPADLAGAAVALILTLETPPCAPSS